MSTKASKRPLLSAHEKVEAIRRVHDGESKASVARDIGVPESTLRGWCKNEDKILYLSRQSTPETSESEPEVKKIKISTVTTITNNVTPTISTEVPATGLNLTTNNNPIVVSTTPEQTTSVSTIKDQQSSVPYDVSTQCLNLTTTPKSSESKKDSISASLSRQHASMSERERNRAELNRLSAELGLNRPEFGLLNIVGKPDPGGINMSMLAASPLSSISHLSGGITAQNNLGLSFNEIAAKVWKQVNQNAAVAAATAAVAAGGSSATLNTSSSTSRKSLPADTTAGLNLTTQAVKQNDIKSLSEDPFWYLLKAQQEVIAQNAQYLSQIGQSVDVNNKSSSWFWKWYKQYYGFVPTNVSPNSITNQNNILLQQLTKDANNKQQITKDKNVHEQKVSSSENKEHKGTSKTDNVKNQTKVRAVLDDLLANNNNVMNQKNEKESVNGYDDYDPPSSPSEALEHGQKFLRWLECCSDPSVTAMQILQFRYLLNNVKTCAERKSSAKNINGCNDKVNRRK